MSTPTKQIELDPSKLYGFRILRAAGEPGVVLAAKLGVKFGAKAGTKVGFKRRTPRD